MSRIFDRKNFYEMDELELLIKEFGEMARVETLAEVPYGDRNLPLHLLQLGTDDLSAPVVGYFAGVHGLEKIGSEVVLAYMRTVLERLKWDRYFRQTLENSRMLFMPIINPVGIVRRTRSNGNGVDIMRNAPIDADGANGPPYRGHRISPVLPWYRGQEGEEPEIETRAIIKAVRKYIYPARVSLTLDVHSGFGVVDRFWFPYSRTKEPFPFIPEVVALKNTLDSTYPHHIYHVEPMAKQYTIHGDVWDYLFEEYHKNKDSLGFLPWTLEMGSWNWVKKNPLHVFNRHGFFHPIKRHRWQRILRRHLYLFDFLHKSVANADTWIDLDPALRKVYENEGMTLWYGR